MYFEMDMLNTEFKGELMLRPEEASRLVELCGIGQPANKANPRTFFPATARRYAEIMSKGDWFQGAPDPIIFGIQGKSEQLIPNLNGQHRVWSVAASKMPTLFTMWLGQADRSVVRSLDNGKKRLEEHNYMFAEDGDHTTNTLMCKVMRAWYRTQNGGISKPMGVPRGIDICESNREAIMTVIPFMRKPGNEFNLVPIYSAAAMLCDQVGPEKVKEFLVGLFDVHTDIWQAAKLARDILTHRSRLSSMSNAIFSLIHGVTTDAIKSYASGDDQFEPKVKNKLTALDRKNKAK